MWIFSKQYGTAARRYGMGQWTAQDQEDLDSSPAAIASMAPSMVQPWSPNIAPADSSGSPLVQAADGTWIDKAYDLASKVLTLDQMRRLQNVNLDRVRAGLSPLPSSVYAQVQPGVNVGISPDTQKFIWIGLGLLGVYLLTQLGGSRK